MTEIRLRRRPLWKRVLRLPLTYRDMRRAAPMLSRLTSAKLSLMVLRNV